MTPTAVGSHRLNDWLPGQLSSIRASRWVDNQSHNDLFSGGRPFIFALTVGLSHSFLCIPRIHHPIPAYRSCRYYTEKHPWKSDNRDGQRPHIRYRNRLYTRVCSRLAGWFRLLDQPCSYSLRKMPVKRSELINNIIFSLSETSFWFFIDSD
jgi:hypothetical protein